MRGGGAGARADPTTTVCRVGDRSRAGCVSLVRILCAVLMGLAACSHAALIGKDLSGYCEKKRHGYYREGFCVGFVIGVMNAMTVRDAQERLRGANAPKGGSVPPRRYCIPEGVTFEQAAEVVIAYLNEHVQFHQRPAAELVDYALAEAWPCRPG